MFVKDGARLSLANWGELRYSSAKCNAVPSWSVQLYYSEYCWKFQLLPSVRKYVFAYFLFHVYL